MKFCIISPAEGLDAYASRSDIHLILPHIRNRKYINFYKNRRAKGDLIILDNGAYEKRLMHSIRIEQRIELYNPQVIVCPDALLGNWLVTWERTKDFLDEFYPKYENHQFMGVPQAQPMDIHGWWECCKHMVGDKRLSWIGLPRALFTHFGEQYLLRSLAAEIIHDNRPDIKIHALGMAAGSLRELRFLSGGGHIYSCDSSAPVWRGWNGFPMQDEPDPAWEKLDLPVNFSAKLPKGSYADSVINHNLGKVFKICLSTKSGLQESSMPADGSTHSGSNSRGSLPALGADTVKL